MQILYGIADGGEVLLKSVLGDDDCAAAVVGMERERRGIFQTAVEKENDVVVGVVNKPERADRTRFQAQITHHPFGRSKRQFAGGFLALGDENLLQPMLYIMDRQVFVARETDEVMPVALVIAHEDVLAMHRPVVMPPTLRLLDGLAFGVVIGREGDVMVLQIPQHFLLPLGNNLVIHTIRSYLRTKVQQKLHICKSERHFARKICIYQKKVVPLHPQRFEYTQMNI